MKKSPLKVHKCEFHRNGITGAPYHVVIFDWLEKGDQHLNMCAFVFEEAIHIAVTKIDMLAEHNVEFAKGNSWRGDSFENEIRDYIKAVDLAFLI